MSQCLFQCDAGYEAMRPQDSVDVTSVLITCGANAQWSVEEPPKCQRTECEQNVTELQNVRKLGMSVIFGFIKVWSQQVNKFYFKH